MLDLSISGDGDSTPFDSLRAGLEGTRLSTQLGGMNHPNLISHIHVTISLESLTTNLVSVDFDVMNPLDADMVIEFVQSEGSVEGKVYAFFGQKFEGLVVPGGQTANSGVFDNVLLVQGALASLDIIPLGVMDISAATTIRIGGEDGYQIPWLEFKQTNVPVSYDLNI